MTDIILAVLATIFGFALFVAFFALILIAREFFRQ